MESLGGLPADEALSRFAAAAAQWAAGGGDAGVLAAVAAVSHGAPLVEPHDPLAYGLDPATRLAPAARLPDYVAAKDAARARAHASAARDARSRLADALRTHAKDPAGRCGAVAAVIRGARVCVVDEEAGVGGMVSWVDSVSSRRVDIYSHRDVESLFASATTSPSNFNSIVASPLIRGVVAAARFALGKQNCVAWTVLRAELLAEEVPTFTSLVHALAQDGWPLEQAADDDSAIQWVASPQLTDRDLHNILVAAVTVGIEDSESRPSDIIPAGVYAETRHPRSPTVVAKRHHLVTWRFSRALTGIGTFKPRRWCGRTLDRMRIGAKQTR